MAETEARVIQRAKDWPDSPDLRGHDELHVVAGAEPRSRRICPACGARFWDNHRRPQEHTVEVCEWNQAWTEKRDAEAGRRPVTGPGSPDIMTVAF